MRQLYEDVKNWGRWGDDDEMGALNLITPEKRREGAAAVLAGETVGCASHGRWAFQFTIAPLRVDGATGSPVNPIAML